MNYQIPSANNMRNSSGASHNYGIDLLRIIAVLMITAHHFSLHSGLHLDSSSVQGIVNAALALHGKTGVNIFVLITGFYSGSKVRREKIINLLGLSSFYSLSLAALACFVGSTALSKKTLLKASFPFLFGNNYWFITTYLELYILTPLLNKAMDALSEKTYRHYLLCFTFMLCILPSVVGKFIETNDFGYSSLIWFVYLYFLGAYFAKYALPLKHDFSTYLWIFLMVFQLAACFFLQKKISSSIVQRILSCAADYSMNAVFPLTIASAMLLSFQKLTLFRGRCVIRKVGAATLGIYLFHDNIYFREWLWQQVYYLVSGNDTVPYVVSAVLTILVVFVTGCVAEIIREYAFRRITKT